MSVLVDSSIWIDYFKGGNNSAEMDSLLTENLVVTNDLILAELVPFLKIKNEQNIIRLLKKVYRRPLIINWDQISEIQFRCLKEGINGIGIPDLIIAQDAKRNDYAIYSLDRHFSLLSSLLKVRLI